MAPNLSDRAQRALDEWSEWTLESFQLRGRKPYGDGSRAWVRVHFVLSVDGDQDEGEDEFDVMKMAGDMGWRVRIWAWSASNRELCLEEG